MAERQTVLYKPSHPSLFIFNVSLILRGGVESMVKSNWIGARLLPGLLCLRF